MYTRFILKQGDQGIAVNKMQAYLNIFQRAGYIHTPLSEDGVYGSRTVTAVKEYQVFARQNPDGVIGNNTWDAIMETLKLSGVVTNIPVASSSYYLSNGNAGIDVFKMQEYINKLASINPCLRPVAVDGAYGNATRIAVQQFQYLNNMAIDGKIGRATWDEIVNQVNRMGR